MAPEETGRKKLFSLRFSLGSAFVGAVLLTSVLLGTVTFLNVRSFIRHEIRERLKAAAAIAALQVDGDAHGQLTTRGDETGDAYQKVRTVLRHIRDRAPDIRFIYTFRKLPDGGIVFIVDAEENTGEMSHIGDPYKEVTPALKEAFSSPHRVRVDEEFYADKWGTWVSSFAPIFRRDGELEAVLGMDMSAAKIVEYERSYLLIIVVISLVVSGIIAVFGLFLSRRITKPLLALAGDMGRIQRFDLEGETLVTSRIHEVEKMEQALGNMKKGLRSFRRYVPADLVSDLINLKKEAVLGAEKRELSILFSDIANFTTLCENMSSEDLIKRLDIYFEGMAGTILEHHGTIDKFIGDAIMAFWGAPRPLENHAVSACLAALQCQRRLDRIFEEWTKSGLPPMMTRIGINTGEVLVGNVGYKERLSYTVLGDHVNLASRLEGLNKFYDTRIIISESTYEHAKSRIEARLLDQVVVKGKTEGVRVYELVAEKGEIDIALKNDTRLFNEAMALFLARKWSEALAIFTELATRRPHDRPVQIQRDRSSAYLAQPPPEDWTGVIVLREK